MVSLVGFDGVFFTATVYMKIHVYSTLAKLVAKEEKKESPDPIHHTLTIQTYTQACTDSDTSME